jgi:hypothetical protein
MILIDPELCTEQLGVAANTNKTHISVLEYIISSVPPTCFSHSCDRPQGGALQRIDTSRYYRSS